MTEKYEYRNVDIRKGNKEFYGFFTRHYKKRWAIVMEKLGNEGWELVNTTQDRYGYPRILTFRRDTPH
jgi:hypothetical protein